MKCRNLNVHLGPDEWGSESMDTVAREAVAADPTLHCVTVHEHGGWFLTFRAADLRIVDTANDAWCMPGDIAQWWRQFDGSEYVESIRRPVAAESEVAA